MTRVEFHPQAEEEFQAASLFYEGCAEGLGDDFVRAVQSMTSRLLEFAYRGKPFGKRLRRVLVPGFPYAILYGIYGDVIWVVAVAHLHRKPNYWRGRG